MNPLDNFQFTHYLNFINIDGFGKIQITEPVGFDANAFVLEQDKNSYARDISYMGDDITIDFYKGFFDPVDYEYMLPSGTITNKLTMGYPFLIEGFKQKGFELECQYILERNGVEFIIGDVMLENTDEVEIIKAMIVQQSDKAKAKRREDTKINMFSDEDIDGNYIEPLQTTNILLKAKPINQKSEWKLLDNYAHLNEVLSDRAYIAPFTNIIKSNIEDTITPFNRLFGISSGQSDEYFWGKMYDTGFLIAKNELTNIVLTFKNIKGSFYLPPNNSSIEDGWFSSLYYKRMVVNLFTTINGGSYDGTNPITYRKFTNELDFEFIGIENVDQFDLDPFYGNAYRYDFTIDEISFELNGINRDTRLSIALQFQRNFCIINWISGEMSIESTSTAIDTVIKGVRYIDMIKQTMKSINGFPVVAPRYDVGGEFYDRFVFSGNLIRRIEDKGFYTTLKDRKANLIDLNGDIQVNDANAVIGQYDEFYSNIDNGGFAIAPNESFVTKFNERYKIINFEYGFKKYETDRDEENTIDAVHTETQYTNKNTKAENIKKVEVDDIYDAFIIETSRKLALKETTALDTDDDTFVIDVVPLAPNSVGGFTAGLTHNINGDGNLQLLSQEGIPFNLLGFSVGDSFTIVNTNNAGTYTVVEIETNLLTLSGSPSNNSGGLPILTEVEYFYTNVAYTNRTNEGFDLIENVLNPDKFSNLKYTIRRNMVHWESYVKTASLWSKDIIRNTFFKNNGELITQFEGGTIYKENENLVYEDLTDAILSPLEGTTEIIVSYDDALELFQKYQDINTYGGFIRVQDNNQRMIQVYPKKMAYTWVSSSLSIDYETRLESDTVDITLSVDEEGTRYININEVGYNEDIISEIFWEIDNGYVRLFDINKINLINFTKFDKVSVSGVVCDNETDLANALIALNG